MKRNAGLYVTQILQTDHQSIEHIDKKASFSYMIYVYNHQSVIIFPNVLSQTTGRVAQYALQVCSDLVRRTNFTDIKGDLGGTQSWTGDLLICSQMLYHWAIPPQGCEKVLQDK